MMWKLSSLIFLSFIHICISVTCTDLNGAYSNGFCFWLTPSVQNYSAGVDVCLQLDANPSEPLLHPDWFCTAQRAAEQLGTGLRTFVGYHIDESNVYTWKGNHIQYTNIYSSMYSSNLSCFGADITGVGLYNCAEDRRMLCNFQNSSGFGSSNPFVLEDLLLDKRTLSSFIRTKTSASDPRTSATVVGSVGVIIIVIFCAGLLIVDIPNIVEAACMARKRIGLLKDMMFQ